jgi:hypothetical protein
VSECCPVMQFVLERTSQQARPVGLTREPTWNFKTGKQSTLTIISFPKAKRGDKSEGARATYAVVDYCPFCGKRLAARKAKP